MNPKHDENSRLKTELEEMEEKKMGNDFKKLVRSKGNRMLCGVCGGIG